MEYSFHLKVSLGNQITINNLVQRHHLKAHFNKAKRQVTLKGAKNDLQDLVNDRGWKQMKKYNHITKIKKD